MLAPGRESMVEFEGLTKSRDAQIMYAVRKLRSISAN